MNTPADTQPIDSPPPGSLRGLIAVMTLALLVRGTICFWNVESYQNDSDAYGAIAKTLWGTGVFGLTTEAGDAIPTAFRPPLYPSLLSLLVVAGELSTWGVALFHTLLGCVTILCSYLVARTLLAARPVGGAILAACLVIVDPVLLHQSTLLMTETLAASLASLVLWWWVRPAKWTYGSALMLGLLLSLAFYCRPTFVVWACLLCAGVILVGRHFPDFSPRGGHMALAFVVLAISIIPWAVRNRVVIGHPVWATTHGGYTLLLGNNPLFYDYLRTGAVGVPWDAGPFLIAYSHRYDGDPTRRAFWKRNWDSPGVITADVTEHDDDQLCYEAAKATIARQRAMFAWSCLVRAARLWSPIPHWAGGRSPVVTIAIGVYGILFYAAVVAGMWNIGRGMMHPRWWPIPALVLTLTLVHAVYWSNIRMRAPAVAPLSIVAAAAICRPNRPPTQSLES